MDKLTFESFQRALKEDPEAYRVYFESLAALEAASFFRALREHQNFTQMTLASRAGVSQSQIGRLERGIGKRGPTVGMIKRIASACNMDLLLRAVPIGAGVEGTYIDPEQTVEVRCSQPETAQVNLQGSSVIPIELFN